MGAGSNAHDAKRRGVRPFSVASDDQADLFRSPDNLGSYGGGTGGAEVFVLVSFRKDQEKALADRHGVATFWAIELCGVKLLEGCSPYPSSGRRLMLICKNSVLHGACGGCSSP